MDFRRARISSQGYRQRPVPRFTRIPTSFCSFDRRVAAMRAGLTLECSDGEMLRYHAKGAYRTGASGGPQRRAVESSASNLIAQAVAGDRAAMITLLEEWTPMLRERLSGRIPPRWRPLFSVEDLLQETYLDAFLGIGRLIAREGQSFAAWLYQIANRNLINALKMLEAEKRGGNRRPVGGPASDASYIALYDLLSGSGSTPSQHLARGEGRSALEHALSQLPGDYRLVVELYDLQGRAMEDVARTLGRSPGAAHLMRFRAHRRLEALLGNVSAYLSTV